MHGLHGQFDTIYITDKFTLGIHWASEPWGPMCTSSPGRDVNPVGFNLAGAGVWPPYYRSI